MLIDPDRLDAEIAARRQPGREPRVLSPKIDLESAAAIGAAMADGAPLVLRHPKRKGAGAVAPTGGFDVALETSGSTGARRLALFDRAAIAAQAAASEAALGWRADERWLVCLSLAHAGGLAPLLRCLRGRRPAILVERFSATGVAAAAADYRATLMSLVPTMLDALLDDGWRPPARLRAVLIGGAAASPGLLRRARERRVPVVTAYGMTETFSHIALEGRLLPGVEARSDDGVVEVRGPMLFRGYAGEPPRDPLAWHRTGDLGRVHGERIEITGRADGVIVSGGENVSPARVELALVDLPEIAEAFVFAIDDPRWGEVVAAAVVPRSRVDLEVIDARLRERLAPFERPRRLWVIDDPPRLPSGKLDRRRLGDMLVPCLISDNP
jgi:O-succinylbenzoic acid--CoA ligase